MGEEKKSVASNKLSRFKVSFVLWSHLRRMGRLRVVKLTILAPFIPFIFSFIDTINEASLPKYFEPFKINWPDPNLDALYWFYYGLWSLAIGSAIYSVRCPRDIKKYSNNVQAIERELKYHARVIERISNENKIRDISN